jgi:hypothetical protein
MKVQGSVRLKVTVALFLIFFVVTMAPAPAAAEVDVAQLVKQVEPALLYIRMYDQNGRAYGLGSGFFISPEGEFVTNRHVMVDAYYAVAMTPNGKEYPITKLTGIHPEADLVKGTVGNVTEPVPYLRISREGVVKGQRIYAFGNPEGLLFTVSDGIVSAFRNMKGLGYVFQMTAPISHGSSGGPVVNVAGEVVGISVAGKDEGQNLNFAVPAEFIGALQPPAGGPIVYGDNRGQNVAAKPGAAPSRSPQQPATKQRYLFVAAYPDYDAYLDLATITLIYNRDSDSYRVEFWVRNIYKPAGKAKVIQSKAREGQGERYYNLGSLLTQLQVKPAVDKFALLRLIYYDDSGSIIDNLNYRQQTLPEEAIAPGSLIEKVTGLVFRFIKEYPNAINKASD